LICLAEAAQIVETTNQRHYKAELYQLRDDLLASFSFPARSRWYCGCVLIQGRARAK
jgi:hypothetical protein